MVMDAGDLQNGFRLGDWVVEPQLGRMSGQGRSHTLTSQQLAILKALAARRGEVIARAVLREHAWPRQQVTDDVLRATLRELRQLLGDSPKDLRYIVPVGRSGYTLIAPVEPLAQAAAAVPGSPRQVVVADSRVISAAQKFVSELGRRHVFRVLGAYLIGMWVLLQVAQTTFAPLHFPDWWMSALTILAVIGIPIVGILAWAYEITPGGIVRDSGDAALLQLPRARRAMAPVLVLGVALMAGVTGFAWWRTIADADGVAVCCRAFCAVRGRAAARRHDFGRRRRVSRRRFREGNLRAGGADPGPARRGPHLGVRIQGTATRRAQDRQRARSSRCPRGERASRRRQAARDGAADRRFERLSRLGRHLRPRMGRGDRHPGRHLEEDHASAAGRADSRYLKRKVPIRKCT